MTIHPPGSPGNLELARDPTRGSSLIPENSGGFGERRRPRRCQAPMDVACFVEIMNRVIFIGSVGCILSPLEVERNDVGGGRAMPERPAGGTSRPES